MQTPTKSTANRQPRFVTFEVNGPPFSSGFWEFPVVAGITIVGFLIRVWRINECGLSHFDAGIYAQSGLWPWTGQFHFQQGYFSPPLYPLLVGLANLLLGGPTDWAGVLVSAGASTLIIPLSWWIARDWWNPFAGILASLLLCFSGMQIVFARVGLTDALFSLLFVAGLAACRTAIAVGGWRRIVMAGALVGLAWNTKYNGFLPLVLACGFLCRSSPWLPMLRLAQISSISISLYLPWAIWFHVQRGYGSLVRHQQGYVQGLTSLPMNISYLLEFMDLMLPSLLVPLVIVAVIILLFKLRVLAGLIVLAGSIIAFALNMYLCSLSVFFMIVLVAPFTLRTWQDRIGTAWSLGCLLVLPAIYAPYLRLWLPTQTFALLLCAGALGSLASLARWPSTDVGSLTKYMPKVLALAFAVLAAVALLYPRKKSDFEYSVSALETRAGYRLVSKVIADNVGKSGKVYTMCRWPMNYYLLLSGVDVRPLSGDPWDLNELRQGDLLVVDRARYDTPTFQSTLDKALQSLSLRSLDNVEPDFLAVADDTQRVPRVDLTSVGAEGPKRPNWPSNQPEDSVLVFERK